MTTTRSSHANCDHEPTKAARARCRAGKAQPARNVGQLLDDSIQAFKKATEAEQLIAQISFETATCDRCGGSGSYPSAAWNGVCLKCAGVGTVLTKNGKRARDKYEAYLAANHTKYIIDVQPGDDIRKQGRWVRVHEVDHTITKGGLTTVGSGDNAVSWCTTNINYTTKYSNGERVVNMIGPYVEVIVRPRGEAAQAAFRHVANMKGCIVTPYEG